jgi:hypothetical protein
MILPSVATLADYGGPKQNDAPVADPVTDEDADERNEYVEDVAGMTNTAIRAWCRFVTVNNANPTDPTNAHGAVWGSALAVKPTVAWSSEGVWLITWPTTVTDELGTVHTISLRGVATPNVEGTTLYHTNATVSSANTVTVRVWNTSNTLSDAVGATVNVQVW